jgi:hypothetical protein
MDIGVFPNELMLAATLTAMVSAAFYAKRKRDYLVAAWMAPLGWLAVYFFVLIANVQPFCDNLALRVALYRPAMFFLLAFMVLHFVNGRFNDAVESVLKRVMRWINCYRQS